MSESLEAKKVYCPSCTDEVVPVFRDYTSKIEHARVTRKKVCPSCMYVFGSTQVKRTVQTY